MQLIPTIEKKKLIKGYSHPISAQEISEGLFCVPQYQELKIQFYEAWSPYYPEAVKNKIKLRIFEIEYSNNGNFPSYWTIKVSPLPQSYRNEANKYLINIALPKMKLWLENVEISVIEDKKRTNYTNRWH